MKITMRLPKTTTSVSGLGMSTKFLVLATLLSVLLVTPASAVVYYISGSAGNNNNPGTESSPWRTLGKANSQLMPGDTVVILEGVYNEAIAPLNSGSSKANRIIYRAQSGNQVTVGKTISLRDKSYITVSGIDISSNSRYIDMTDASYITIENSTMREPGSNPAIKMDGTSYSVLRGNDILGKVLGYQDVVQMRRDSRFNLIEDNRISQASHSLIDIQGNSNFDETDPHNNIIRNNVFNNEVHHCTNVAYGASNNVFEGNLYEKCGTGAELPKQPVTGFGSSGEALHAWQPKGIYRFNTVMYSGDRSVGGDDSAAFGGLAANFVNGVAKVIENRVYNNVFTRNYDVAFRLGTLVFNNSSFPASEIEYGNNKFKNNILYDNGIAPNKNGETAIKYVKFGGPTPKGDVWAGNLIEGTGENSIEWRGTAYTVAEAEASFPSNIIFRDNITGDPLFVDSANFDFQLRANSPAIDAGVFLTSTTSSGSSSDSVNVEDARYFIDGFGIVQGDEIQISSETVVITGVDYDANVLTLDRAISWSNGDGVSFPYSGTAPDIGAHEFKINTLDYDEDGLPDSWEVQYGLDPFNADDATSDLDGDTLSNLQEFNLKTSPALIDTDNDGVNDNVDLYPTDSTRSNNGSDNSNAFQQSTDTQGMVSMDAENFDSNTPRGKHRWSSVSSPIGFAGTAAMQAVPDDYTNRTSGYSITSPVLDYSIEFVKTGIHYVWLRASGVSKSSNSLHIGLNGQENITTENIQLTATGDYTWVGGRSNTLSIDSTGMQTLNVWMRESGATIDKIVLTTDPDFIPTGTGPIESLKRGGTTNDPRAVNEYEEVINLPACDVDNPEVQFIRTDADWSAINDESKRIFCVQPGNYTALGRINLSESGTRTAPRYLRYYTPENPTDTTHPVNASEANRAVVVQFHLIGASWWVVDGLTFRTQAMRGGAARGTVRIRANSDNNIFNRVLIENGREMFEIQDRSDFNVLQNSVIRNARLRQDLDSHCAIIFNNIRGNRFVNNELYNCTDGIQLWKGTSEADIADIANWDIKETVIYNNDFYVTQAFLDTCFVPPDAGAGCIENAIDIKMTTDESTATENRTLIKNNRMSGYPSGAVIIHYPYSRGIDIQDNIIFDSDGGVSLLKSGGNDITISNNLFYRIQLDSNRVTVPPWYSLGRVFWFEGSFADVKAFNNTVVDAGLYLYGGARISNYQSENNVFINAGTWEERGGGLQASSLVGSHAYYNTIPYSGTASTGNNLVFPLVADAAHTEHCFPIRQHTDPTKQFCIPDAIATVQSPHRFGYKPASVTPVDDTGTTE